MPVAVIARDRRNGQRRGNRLRAGGCATLVRTALDASSSFLSRAVLAGVDKTVLDTSATWTAFVALLARLLAVDARVLDLLALGAHGVALHRVVALLLVHSFRGVMALVLAAGHHVGVVHLVRAVQLAVGVHLLLLLLLLRGMMRVVALLLAGVL